MDKGSENKASVNKPTVDKTALEGQFFELVSYMTVSARNLIEEPARYGPFRLVDSVSRLVDILEAHGLSSERLYGLQAKIEGGKYSAMGPEKEYEAFLEGLVSYLVGEIGK
jgi:hypothetical protein